MTPALVIVQQIQSASLSADGATITATVSCLLIPVGGSSSLINVTFSSPSNSEMHSMNNNAYPAIVSAVAALGYSTQASSIMMIMLQRSNN